MFVLPEYLIEKLSGKSANANDTSVTCSVSSGDPLLECWVWTQGHKKSRERGREKKVFRLYILVDPYDHSLLQVLRISRHKVANGTPAWVQSARSTNGERQTVLLVANRRINQMALCKPAIIFLLWRSKTNESCLAIGAIHECRWPFWIPKDHIVEYQINNKCRSLFLVIQPFKFKMPS